MTKDLKHKIAWAGFELGVPPDWEINRHVMSCRQGKLVLVDRRRQRMEVVWRSAENKLDINHLCHDLMKRVRKNSVDGTLLELRSSTEWTGFWLPLDETSVIAYAFQWYPKSKRMFQLTIVTRDDEQMDQSQLVDQILANFKDNGWQQKGIQWKAFGVDCTSPPGWMLVSTKTTPMDIKLQFRDGEDENKDQENEITIQRLGMADSWFNGDIQSFIRASENKLDFELGNDIYCGHKAVTAVAQKENTWFDRVRGRQRIHRELSWLCEPMNSLFRVTAVHSPNKPVQPQDIAVTCELPA